MEIRYFLVFIDSTKWLFALYNLTKGILRPHLKIKVKIWQQFTVQVCRSIWFWTWKDPTGLRILEVYFIDIGYSYDFFVLIKFGMLCFADLYVVLQRRYCMVSFSPTMANDHRNIVLLSMTIEVSFFYLKN